MPFTTTRISDDISLIREDGVAWFLSCNIWHVRGRNYDLVIDTGMGISPLKEWVLQETEKPLKAVITHTHFDHCGSLHEFDCRLGHKSEADILQHPTHENTLFNNDWASIEFIDSAIHPEASTKSYSLTPAPLTGYLDEGDIIDLGNKAYQILHLPGHSHGSIGLWDIKEKTLFSGDAVYDGELYDNLTHSDPVKFRQTLTRIQSLNAATIHGGHFASFDNVRLNQIVSNFLRREI